VHRKLRLDNAAQRPYAFSLPMLQVLKKADGALGRKALSPYVAHPAGETHDYHSG